MTMYLYVYSKCSTCQQAVNFLKQKNVRFIRKEIVDEPPSVQELELMLKHANGNLKKLFNSSGQLYRELKLSEKLEGMSLSESLNLLSKHGMLIKRPFLLGENFGCLGFNEKEWSQHF